MTKVELTTNELVELFEEQIDLLRTHCQTYDSGKISIYKDIAVKLRLLLRETKNQKSLFRQLNIHQLLFINSANPIDQNNLLPTAPLLIMNSSGISISNISFSSSSKPNSNEKVFITDFNSSGFTFTPCYDRHLSNESFEEWWASQIILTDAKENKFTREMIVLSVSDNFGGAHVDPHIKQPFYEVVNQNSIGINVQQDSLLEGLPNAKSATFTFIGQTNLISEDPINTPIPPSIRQIAEEVIRTVESRIKVVKDGGSASICFIETKTKRELQYDYNEDFKYQMPNKFENFQKIITHYFSLRRPDDIEAIYKELKNKKISSNRLIKCYLRNIEKFKKEEIELFGYSGDGWSLHGIINKIASKLK